MASRTVTYRAARATPRGALVAAALIVAGLGGIAALIAPRWDGDAVAPAAVTAGIYVAALVAALGVARAARLVHDARPRAPLAYVPAALTLLVFLVAVEALLRAYRVPAGFIPTPTRVFQTLLDTRPVLVQDAVQTFALEALTGYAAGCAAGIALALLVARFDFLERGLLPYATAFSSIPIVALAPVLVKAVGIEWPSKAAVVAITVFFPVVVNTARGLNEVNPLALDLMRAYAATEAQVFAKLRVPNALPYVFNALKLGATLAMIGAIVGEFFGTTGSGLGFRIQIEAGRFGFDVVWAAIIVASIIGIAFYAAVAWLERRVTGWHVSFREEN